jgi:tetraacyldisaccharide-1-P 4'-kinase
MFNLHVRKQFALSKSVRILKYFRAKPKVFLKTHRKNRIKHVKTLCSETGCFILCVKVNHQHQSLKKNVKIAPITKPNSLTNSHWTTPINE